jgi:hypothetical protein
MPYTYLGRLSYLTHDTERQQPVHFQWQLIDDWPRSEEVLSRIGLQLSPSPAPVAAGAVAEQPTPLVNP